jgi:murein DD-endopeptidase MepM/ murein hydrolase activator NlpD
VFRQDSPNTEGHVLARHRSPGGELRTPALQDALEQAAVRSRPSLRVSPPVSAVRGRIVVAAVAVGAFAAAAAGQTLHSGKTSNEDFTPLAGTDNAAADFTGTGGGGTAAPELLIAGKPNTASLEAQKMAQSQAVTQRTADSAAEAAQPKFVKPAQGVFTSGFGSRWGTTHFGIDIANVIGTPIVAVADGTVIEAGPASGFGLWVRIQHADGTITVYGHMNDFVVHEGQQVKAGQLIAHIGNRGNSTGPHLHFEVWEPGGMKINPQPWLAARGITL